MFKNIQPLKVLSVIVLLGVSSVLGFLSLTTEMGLAILAGAIGLAFSNIDKISSFEGAGFKAEMRKKIEAVVEKETEQDADTAETVSSEQESETSKESIEYKLLLALNSQRYTWRTLSGLSKETGYNQLMLIPVLQELSKLGYIMQSQGDKGLIWSLTLNGRHKLKSLA
ncbi:MAG TPA: hypothetical protein VIQ81_13625 [Gammaproteobacteria bacterium]